MSEENKKLNTEDLEAIAGGAGAYGPSGSVHDLSVYAAHKVAHLPSGTSLVMKTNHNASGVVMPGHQFYNGDTIWVNSLYWEGGCYLAFDRGEYGYVDARYVD